MKKAGKQSDRPTLYGFHAVREAWLNDERVIRALYLTESSFKGFEEVLLLARQKGLRRPEPIILDKNRFDKMLPQGAVHQGVALSAPFLEESDVQDFVVKAHSQDAVVLAVLDQVTDPQNVGAIMRSASAFGVDGLIMQKKHAPALHGVLAKIACGAVDHLPVAQATNLSRAIQDLQNEGFFVVGLDERGEDHLADTLAHYKSRAGEQIKLVLVLGSEGDGIRRLIKEHCDVLAKLPTQGAIASLNVSNAAAVSFYSALQIKA